MTSRTCRPNLRKKHSSTDAPTAKSKEASLSLTQTVLFAAKTVEARSADATSSLATAKPRRTRPVNQADGTATHHQTSPGLRSLPRPEAPMDQGIRGASLGISVHTARSADSLVLQQYPAYSVETPESEIENEPVSEIHHTCHDPSCKDPNHWRLAHDSCNNKEAGRQGRREKILPRARLGHRHYRDTKILLYREQKGLCYLCNKPGPLNARRMRAGADSVQRERDRESMPVAGLHEPLVPEIEIATTLCPWYWDWLVDHTRPNVVLTKNQAIHVATRDAKETFGYGANQTIRGYLKDWTTPDQRGQCPFRVDRSDTSVGLQIKRGNWPRGWKEPPTQ